jgi:hypothetical protein
LSFSILGTALNSEKISSYFSFGLLSGRLTNLSTFELYYLAALSGLISCIVYKLRCPIIIQNFPTRLAYEKYLQDRLSILNLKSEPEKMRDELNIINDSKLTQALEKLEEVITMVCKAYDDQTIQATSEIEKSRIIEAMGDVYSAQAVLNRCSKNISLIFIIFTSAIVFLTTLEKTVSVILKIW